MLSSLKGKKRGGGKNGLARNQEISVALFCPFSNGRSVLLNTGRVHKMTVDNVLGNR